MTTRTLPEPPADCLRRWAAEQLDLPADISPGEAKAAFLVRLRDEDFMPPLRWQQAYSALAGKPASAALREQVLAEEEERLRGAVETFAVEFFRVEIPARKERWQELRDQCGVSPQLTARLRGLEPGLRVPADPPSDDPDMREVADHLRELFVLRPQERAVRRQELLHQVNPQARVRMAQAARAIHPQLAALEPDYMHQLTTWNRRAMKRTDNRQKREREAVAAGAGGSPQGGGWQNYWWIVVLVIMALRALSSGTNTRTSDPPSYHFKPATIPNFDFEKWKRDLDKRRGQPEGAIDWLPGEATRRLLDLDPNIRDDETKKRIEELRKRILERELVLPTTPDTRRSVPRP